MVIVETTVAKRADAERLAEGLVETGLAACVAISAQTAVYRWRGKVEHSKELLLRIKTTRARVESAIRWLQSEHPYDVPEVIVVRAKVCSKKYEKWLVANTTAKKK